MSLIGIACVKREGSEIAPAAIDGVENAPKPQHPGESLWPVADRLMEATTELALANRELSRDLMYIVACQLTHGFGDDRIAAPISRCSKESRNHVSRRK